MRKIEKSMRNCGCVIRAGGSTRPREV